MPVSHQKRLFLPSQYAIVCRYICITIIILHFKIYFLFRMRCTFHRIMHIIFYICNFNINIGAVRHHNFYNLPDRKFITLFKVCSAIVGCCYSEIGIFLDIGIVVIYLCILVRFAEEKSGCIFSVCTFGYFFFVKRDPASVIFLALKIIVYRKSVCPRNRCHI